MDGRAPRSEPRRPVLPAELDDALSVTAPDVPGVLRAWCGDIFQQELAAGELAAGNLVRIATSDETTEYELLAESVDALRMQRTLPLLSMPAA